MKDKGKSILKAFLGCYLMYLGIRILIQVTKYKPSNGSTLSFLAVLFLAVGGTYAYISVRRIVPEWVWKKAKSSEEEELEEEELEEEEPEEEELDANVSRSISLVSVGPNEREEQKDSSRDLSEDNSKDDPENNSEDDPEENLEDDSEDNPEDGPENSSEDRPEDSSEKESEDRLEDNPESDPGEEELVDSKVIDMREIIWKEDEVKE